MRRLSDRISRNTTESILKTADNETEKVTLNAIYRALEDIVKQAVDSVVADNAISFKRERLTKSQKFAQNTVVGLMTTPTSTAPVTTLVKKHGEI